MKLSALRLIMVAKITLSWVFRYAVLIAPALAIYWYNEPPAVTYSQRKVLTPQVAPGDNLLIAVSAEMGKFCSSTVTRSIIDSAGVVTTFEPAARPAMSSYTINLPVPLGAFPGPARYSADVAWECNPLQKWFPYMVHQADIAFEIVPASEQEQLPERQGIWKRPFKFFSRKQ